MKTKDFIKMLQEADPKGEGYVRLPCSGAPAFATNVEGYWDGAYEYLDKNEDGDSVLVTSTNGYKVDIYCTDIDSIIWEENGNLERINKRIRYDLTYSDNDERLKHYYDYVEKEAAFARDYHEKSLNDWTQRVIHEYYIDGWEIRQPLNSTIGHYNKMYAFKRRWIKDKKINLCQGECMAIIESGKFYPEQKNDFYVWHLSEEKGKNWSLK